MIRAATRAAIIAGMLATGAPAIAGARVDPPPFSVLTYNVEGLPWPVRLGRAAQLARIGDTLRTLRREGRQPHVIVLQEAFTPEAKQIAQRAGYRYIADGPARTELGAPARSPAERTFQASASGLLGETEGKWLDSGLRIASDYPIVAVRRLAYPRFACAGFDCLANKGALAVALRVPGAADPIVVVATHLNSRAASHAPRPRALYAYQRQVDALTQFVRRVVPSSAPFVLAGDLNVGQRIDRHSYLVRNVATWRADAPIDTALDACLPNPACGKRNLADIRFSLHRARDWQFFSPGRTLALKVDGLVGLFGHDAAGMMLSDHVGYVASYQLTRLVGPHPLTIAAR